MIVVQSGIVRIILLSVQVVPAFVALSFIGWIVFVAGFGLQNKEYALSLQCRSSLCSLIS